MLTFSINIRESFLEENITFVKEAWLNRWREVCLASREP
jgi:hypothetical protein